jgi:hypothetical protein
MRLIYLTLCSQQAAELISSFLVVQFDCPFPFAFRSFVSEAQLWIHATLSKNFALGSRFRD